ncbi:PAS domain-containing protein [Alteriqipengyuania sp. 357]
MTPIFWFILAFALTSAAAAAHLLLERGRLRAATDSTERDQAWLALAEDVGAIATWSLSVARQEITWSDRVFAIHARDKAEGTPTLGEAIGYYHPEDRDMVRENLDRSLEVGCPFEIRARLVDENALEKTVIARGVCKVGPTGEVAELFGVLMTTAPSISINDVGNDNPEQDFIESGYRASD